MVTTKKETTEPKSSSPPVVVDEPALKKFIFVSRAVYLQQYVVNAYSMEDANALFCNIKDNEEERDLVMLQQLMSEELVDIKETH